MIKNIFIYENELNELKKEFEELNQNKNIIPETNNDSNTGLNVSKDNTNTIGDLLNKLKKYVDEHNPTLAILTPYYSGLRNSEYTICLINTIKIFESQGFPIKIFFLNNDSLVSRARNNLIGSAMLDSSITLCENKNCSLIYNRDKNSALNMYKIT